MEIESFGISDTGVVREHNEDNFLDDAEDGLFIVADGMGGLSKGDVASKIAVDSIENFVKQSRLEDITWPIKPQDDYSMEENRFLAAVSLANWNIYKQFTEDPGNRGMGTTLVGLLVDGDKVILANVGDSRIYRIRDEGIKQVTDDHSLVMEEVRKGNMTPEEARNHPQKHVINRALGISDSIKVDISSLEYQEQDIYLLCSDGLSDMVRDEEIMSLAESTRDKPLEELGKNLIDAAKKKGGHDNITVVLVRFQ